MNWLEYTGKIGARRSFGVCSDGNAGVCQVLLIGETPADLFTVVNDEDQLLTSLCICVHTHTHTHTSMLRPIKCSTIVVDFIIRDAFGRLFNLVLLSTSKKQEPKRSRIDIEIAFPFKEKFMTRA